MDKKTDKIVYVNKTPRFNSVEEYLDFIYKNHKSLYFHESSKLSGGKMTFGGFIVVQEFNEDFCSIFSPPSDDQTTYKFLDSVINHSVWYFIERKAKLSPNFRLRKVQIKKSEEKKWQDQNF